MPGDDAMHHREAEAGALADRLGACQRAQVSFGAEQLLIDGRGDGACRADDLTAIHLVLGVAESHHRIEAEACERQNDGDDQDSEMSAKARSPGCRAPLGIRFSHAATSAAARCSASSSSDSPGR
jgi:hypothetical protein